MTNKEKIHQILSSLWKNDDSVGKAYYNQALQDVQTAIDLQEEHVKCSAYKNPQDCEIYPDCSDCMGNISEEPVSDDFEKALASEWKAYNDRGAATVDALEDNTQELAFAKGFYRGSNWQKEKALKESEDAIQYVKENHSPSEVSDFQNAMNISVMKAFDAGKEKKREQMMANAIDAEVLENYDGKVIKYDDTILDEKLSNCKVFDKVKVIIIKED